MFISQEKKLVLFSHVNVFEFRNNSVNSFQSCDHSSVYGLATSFAVVKLEFLRHIVIIFQPGR